jgi:hypothetical protein
MGKCTLTVFTKSLAREVNQALGTTNEVDRAFKRHDEQHAARPLSAERFTED